MFKSVKSSIGKKEIMASFLLFSIAAVVTGGLTAWFVHRSFKVVAAYITLWTSLVLGGTLLITEGPPQVFSFKYLTEGAIYFIFPYIVFLWVPGLVAGAITFLVRRKMKKSNPTQ